MMGLPPDWPQRLKAFGMGVDACRDKKPRSDNPLDLDSKYWQIWNNGWDAENSGQWHLLSYEKKDSK